MENLPRRVLNIVYNIEKDKSKVGILSLDIFMAFDCIEWPTLKVLFKGLGFWKEIQGDNRSIIFREYLCSNS